MEPARGGLHLGDVDVKEADRAALEPPPFRLVGGTDDGQAMSLVLAFDEWPAADRPLWESLFTESDPREDRVGSGNLNTGYEWMIRATPA